MKETVVNGIEGLNINLVAPFKIQDYVVGFRYALGNLNKVPESIFARKSFDTMGDGKLTVDADYVLVDNNVKVSSSWTSDSLGVAVGVTGDSRDKVTQVEAQKDAVVAGNKFSLKAAYDLTRKVVSGFASCDVQDTLLQVDYCSGSQDPVLSVTRALDAHNEITPSISLKTGQLAYAWRRRWAGGSLQAKLLPSDPARRRVELEWTDEGASGVWTTNAEFPLDDSSKCKISVSRDWKY